ncbi:hypothetical protein Z043_105865, partial [Scleropages formosus]
QSAKILAEDRRGPQIGTSTSSRSITCASRSRQTVQQNPATRLKSKSGHKPDTFRLKASALSGLRDCCHPVPLCPRALLVSSSCWPGPLVALLLVLVLLAQFDPFIPQRCDGTLTPPSPPLPMLDPGMELPH